MIDVLLPMTGLIASGVVWRAARPAGLDPVATRQTLTSLVYYLLLPALVLSVLWKADLGTRSLHIAGIASAGILSGLVLSAVTCRLCKSRSAEAGALMLASAFPNVTYLGLPVLEATFGPWARSVAIQYDLFASTPLLFTVGILVAARMGAPEGQSGAVYKSLIAIPALWAALLAVVLNLLQVPLPPILGDFLALLERGVVPLMLISLGLSLEWKSSRWRLLPMLIPVVLLSLFIIPALVLWLSNQLGLTGEFRAAVVMEAAMPSMVIGLVLCDRFKLDASLYAAAVTVTTALSLVTLPMWYGWLMG